MKRTLEQLSRLCRLEDFFSFFGLGYDADVIDRYRAAILKQFATEVAAIEARRPMPDEDERLEAYSKVLWRAHEEASRAAPRARRFRVIEGGQPRF